MRKSFKYKASKRSKINLAKKNQMRKIRAVA